MLVPYFTKAAKLHRRGGGGGAFLLGEAILLVEAIVFINFVVFKDQLIAISDCDYLYTSCADQVY